MKILTLLSLLIFISTNIQAKEVLSSKNSINISRVVDLVKLVDKDDIKVNVTVSDIGGSTDVSPTQNLYFSIYSKGEMFSTDASFDLGQIYSLKNATTVSGGIYELQIVGANQETTMPEDQTLIIDAVKAIVSLKNVKCDDFDCDASTKFESTINVDLK